MVNVEINNSNLQNNTNGDRDQSEKTYTLTKEEYENIRYLISEIYCNLRQKNYGLANVNVIKIMKSLESINLKNE